MGMGPVKSIVYSTADKLLSEAVRRIDQGDQPYRVIRYIIEHSGLTLLGATKLVNSLTSLVTALNDASERSH